MPAHYTVFVKTICSIFPYIHISTTYVTLSHKKKEYIQNFSKWLQYLADCV